MTTSNNDNNSLPNIPDIPENAHNAVYAPMRIDVPLKQPLRFVLGYSQAYYLPPEYTTDEQTHLIEHFEDLITQGRTYQWIRMRQGDSSPYQFDIRILDGKTGQPADLSNAKMFTFRGRDAQGKLIISEDGFETHDAAQGHLTWSPPAVVSAHKGYFKTAQFVIESEDRLTTYATLDFSILIIGSNVAFPPEFAYPYVDEYKRILINFKQLQDNADSQIGYLVNYAAVVADGIIKTLIKQTDDFIKQEKSRIETELASDKNQLATLESQITEGQKKLDVLKAGLQELTNKELAFEQKINDKGLVTKDEIQPLFYQAIQQMLVDGKIDFNDDITNPEDKAKLLRLSGELNNPNDNKEENANDGQSQSQCC